MLERVRGFLGPDYFDPCPASYGRVAVNGLAIPWHGRVFCNPPYGAAIVPWIRKAMTEPVQEVVLLVPAYTDIQWFAPLFDGPICFVRGRITFESPTKAGRQAPHPSVIAYRGRRVRKFADAFADLGPILRPYRAMMPPQPQLMSAHIALTAQS